MRKYVEFIVEEAFSMDRFNTKFKQTAKEEDGDILVKTPLDGAVITKCTYINGNIKSCEPIIIKGHIVGDIVCEDIVVILFGGTVTGRVEAKEVRVDGRVEGAIEAKIVEHTSGANSEGYIVADIGIINGYIDGDIVCKETLEIGKDAVIKCCECRAEVITVEGEISGNITAYKLLEASSSATLRGKIKAKELKIEAGSKILGLLESFLNPNIITNLRAPTAIDDTHNISRFNYTRRV